MTRHAGKDVNVTMFVLNQNSDVLLQKYLTSSLIFIDTHKSFLTAYRGR